MIALKVWAGVVGIVAVTMHYDWLDNHVSVICGFALLGLVALASKLQLLLVNSVASQYQ